MEKKNISKLLKVNGKIDVPPQNMVSISVPFGGYLKSTHLLPGTHINKGDVIATIEDQSYIQFQQEYLIAKTQIVYLENEYNRQLELSKSKATSEKSFQQASADFNSQKILLKSYYEKLKLLSINPENLNENNLSRAISITSPITGVVSKVNANIGKYIPATDVLFELINPTDIHLNFTIFEKDIDKLFIGQKVVAFSNHKPDEKYICEIILISSDLKPDRTAEVHCHFEKYSKSLLPGMYMNAEISIDMKNSFAIKEEALVLFENEHYVFVEKSKNQFEMTKVQVGQTQDDYTLIENYEALTDKNIVTKGAYALLMKLKNVVEE
ncbi:MAG: efflux RND transporter periplasmic adaptor subunit [Bacteroidetes bacterium]|nr:efflux RND transporter periplasmic adaptor subunit [Bacteroidota bacterium]